MEATKEEITISKSNNWKLRSLVEELTLEINFYKAEVKRYKRENVNLEEVIKNLKKNLQQSIEALTQNCPTSLVHNSVLLKAIISNPFRSIADMLKLQDTLLVITSAQAPFFIEYSNKSWNVECGWDSAEIQGHTCAILQGIGSDFKKLEKFMKDIKLTGYAQMRNVNYRKNDEPFIVTTTVFPIYDVSSCATTPEEKESEQLPVITHFASVMTNVEMIKLDPVRQAHSKAADMARLMRVKKDYQFDEDVKFDRRIQAQRFPPLMYMSAENFYQNGEKLRLSNLLRLMISCLDALVLTDNLGRVLHANKAWSELTGYSLRDVEGKTCSFMQGELTDMTEVCRCNELLRMNNRVEMTVVNYKKDGSTFQNRVLIIPIRGGLTATQGVTHFAALLLPLSEIPLAVDGFDDNDDASSLSSCSGNDVDDEEDEEDSFETEEEIVFIEGPFRNNTDDNMIPMNNNNSDLNTALIAAANESSSSTAAVESDSSGSSRHKRQHDGHSSGSDEEDEESITHKRRSNHGV